MLNSNYKLQHYETISDSTAVISMGGPQVSPPFYSDGINSGRAYFLLAHSAY